MEYIICAYRNISPTHLFKIDLNNYVLDKMVHNDNMVQSQFV